MIGRLNLYLIRRFFVWLMIVTLGFGAVAMLGDFLEMLRFANKFDLGAGTAFNFTLHRLPLLMMDFLPFIFLFAAVFCLLRLSQAQELAIIRAAGLSVWQFLRPFLVFTFVFSVTLILVLEPIGVDLKNDFSARQAELTSQKTGLSFSTGGIWFRETYDAGSYVARVDSIGEESGRLLNLDIMLLDPQGLYSGRITAPHGLVADGALQLDKPTLFRGNELPRRENRLSLPTSLNADNLGRYFHFGPHHQYLAITGIY